MTHGKAMTCKHRSKWDHCMHPKLAKRDKVLKCKAGNVPSECPKVEKEQEEITI